MTSLSSSVLGRQFDLSGRVAIITGGAGLLGRMHAEAIAEAGGFPVLADVRTAGLAERADSLKRQFGVRALAVQSDLSVRAEVEKLRDRVLSEFGRIDILINNAARDPKVDGGSLSDTRFETFSIESWTNDLSAGLTTAFLCCQVLGDVMAKQGTGSIVNISSDLGLIGPNQRLYEQPGLPPEQQPKKPVSYSVVKSAVLGLTRYLATYWGDRNVRVNAICPGGVENGQSEEFKARLHSLIPMGRMARQDEYKGVLVFLASDASSYMTGAVLSIDGGRTAW